MAHALCRKKRRNDPHRIFPIMHLYRPHPWHGLDVGPDPPDVLNAFIEITPFDLMKYEVDKISGYLRVDRPQRYFFAASDTLRIHSTHILRRSRARSCAGIEAGRRRPTRRLHSE